MSVDVCARLLFWLTREEKFDDWWANVRRGATMLQVGGSELTLRGVKYGMFVDLI